MSSVASQPTNAPAANVSPGRVLAGIASWYCLSKRSPCTVGYGPDQLVAAAGPALRAALGPGWRGTAVTVTARGVSVRVQLIDWMGNPAALLDLYAGVFRELAPLGVGLVDVEVRPA